MGSTQSLSHIHIRKQEGEGKAPHPMASVSRCRASPWLFNPASPDTTLLETSRRVQNNRGKALHRGNLWGAEVA